MGPKIFELCILDAGLLALLGADPFRFFPAGEAPQDTEKPYVVWFVSSGRPENFLAGRPDMDAFTIQIDCYAKTLVAARVLARAVRDAVEGRCHVRTFYGESRDQDTKLYNVSFDVEWFEPVV